MLIGRKEKIHQVPEKGNEDLSPLSPRIKALLKKIEHSSLTPINDWLGLCKSFMSLLMLPQSLII